MLHALRDMDLQAAYLLDDLTDSGVVAHDYCVTPNSRNLHDGGCRCFLTACSKQSIYVAGRISGNVNTCVSRDLHHPNVLVLEIHTNEMYGIGARKCLKNLSWLLGPRPCVVPILIAAKHE